MGIQAIFAEYLSAFLCLGFIKKKTLTSMHKLHQRSLPLDPTGIILKTCCNSTGVIQTVCPHDEEDSVPCSYKYYEITTYNVHQ